jgi:hypothetical protein
MFDFLYGGKERLDLIRELLRQRVLEVGFGDLESKSKISALGNFKLVQTPEALIVLVVDTVKKRLQIGHPLHKILTSLESDRRRTGEDTAAFNEILSASRGGKESEFEGLKALSMSMYIHYRMDIENPGLMTRDQINRAIEQSVKSLS